MGSPCQIHVMGEKKPELDEFAEECRQQALGFEKKYSRYRSDSILTKINRSAGKKPTKIDAETFALLNYAQVCYEQSKGFFDITSGVLRNLWNAKTVKFPSERDLEEHLNKIGFSKLRFNDKEAFLPINGMELDFGGIVKEYAADALAATARKRNISFGLINLGGDIAIIGPRADGAPWQFGIAHPVIKGRTIATIQLSNGSLTTSGGYERFVEIEGERYSHLLNPKTGIPFKSILSASVIADQAIVAGSITSIALLNEETDGLDWLESCDLPYLAIKKNLDCIGSLARNE